MESLRAFMLVTSVKDVCEETDFTFDPPDVETNSATSETIIEHGFHMMFRTTQARNAAVAVIKTAGSVQGYQQYDCPPPAPSAASPAAPAAPAVTAAGEPVESPMPGTILRVEVAQGAAVKEGQLLVVLEAMKMENEILAPKDGTVAQVVVQKGSHVETGSPLIILA